MYARFALPILFLASLACGAEPQAIDVDERQVPAAFEVPRHLVASKSDDLTDRWTSEADPLVFGEDLTGRTDETPFRGHAFDAAEGDIVELSLVADEWAVLAVYGPQASDGAWGEMRVYRLTDFVDWGRDETAFRVKLSRGGHYLAVVGPVWTPSVEYVLGAACVDGPCAAVPELPRCVVGGCSGQLCSDAALGDLVSTCEYRPQYACVRLTTCGNFAPEGGCAWEATEDYERCLESASNMDGGVPIGVPIRPPGPADPPAPEAPAGSTCGLDEVEYQEASVDEVVAAPADFSGARVALSGVAQPGPAACTRMACTTSNPCCNTCSASMRLHGAGASIDLEGRMCHGDSCTWRKRCELEAGSEVRALGTLILEDGGQVRLALDATCAAE